MREIARLAILLAAIAAACAAILVYVDNTTASARAETATRKGLAAVGHVLAIQPGDGTRIVEVPGIPGAYAALGDSSSADIAGIAIVGRSSHGYGGDVELVAGFGADGKLVDFEVTDAHETPGLGAKIARPAFRAGFAGRLFDSSWVLRKDGGDIDAVTSATISSRAAAEAVADAASRYAAARSAILNAAN